MNGFQGNNTDEMSISSIFKQVKAVKMTSRKTGSNKLFYIATSSK